ncbi:hypothetical protein Tco_1153542 [Tanacetum coccineum]
MELENSQNNALAKLPMLKLGEYEMWEIRIKQYFQIQDYALWEVIENGNSLDLEGMKQQRLKQQYENFNASSSESLDSIFNRLQKLVSRLAILGVVTPPEDLNVKFLRSLPSEWDTHVVVWMNKPDFDTMGLDDLYNNFKIVEQKVKKSTADNNDDKNLAFLTTSSPSKSTASFSDATVYAFLSTQPQGSQLVHEDLEQLHDDDLEEMDLKWNMALLSMRARKFYQRTGRKIIIDGSSTAGYDKSKDGAEFDWSTWEKDEIQATWLSWQFTDSEEIALLKRSVGHKEYLMGLLKTELEKVKEEKEGFEFKIAKFEKSSKDLDQLLASQITDKSKKGFGYNVVPSPHPLILNRPTPLDLSYSGLQEFKQPEVNEYGLRDSSVMSITGCDKESDNSKENIDDSLKQQQKTDSSLVKSSLKVDKDWKEKFFCPANQVREEEPKKARENNDAPIIEDWVSDDEDEVEPIPKVEKKTVIPAATKKEFVKSETPVRRSVSCHIAHNICSKDVLMKTGLKTVNNAKPVNTVRARGFNAVKPSACWVWRPIKPNGASLSNSQLNDKGFVDSGCSRHMSGNIAHLSDFKDFDGGYVTFGGGANGGRITGKDLLLDAHYKIKMGLMMVAVCRTNGNADQQDLMGQILHLEDYSGGSKKLELWKFPTSYAGFFILYKNSQRSSIVHVIGDVQFFCSNKRMTTSYSELRISWRHI